MDNILIADCMEHSIQLINRYLTYSGYNINTATTGASTLKKARLLKPDLIILDVSMPDISGYDICKLLKSDDQTKYILILMISTSDSKESIIRALEVSADDYLAKPFEKTLLLFKVKSLLRIKNLSDQLKQKYVEAEEKNKLIDMQLNTAMQVQRSLIKDFNFTFNDVSFVTKYLPAFDVGGDFYDIIMLDDHKMGVIIGDVSGHGISAALLTSMLTMMFRNNVIGNPDPEKLLHKMNDEFCAIFENSTSSMYACVFYAVIDTLNKKITYSNAGQALPVYYSSSQNAAHEVKCSGTPLGLLANSTYEVYHLNYEKDDIILLQTDGLSSFYFKDSPDNFIKSLKDLLLQIKDFKSSEDILDMILLEYYNYDITENEKFVADDVSLILCKM